MIVKTSDANTCDWDFLSLFIKGKASKELVTKMSFLKWQINDFISIYIVSLH